MAAVLLIAGIAPLRVVAVPQNAVAPGASRIAFEVASIRPNAQGFIDLGGGLRLLSGRTRCQATDTPLLPGDPLPSPGLGRCAVRNSTVKEMIDVAYGLRFGPVRAVLNQMIIGGPAWVETAIFDIDAKAEDPYATTQQMQAMFRTLIAERFKLTFHREPRQMTGLALVVSKGGHKLKEGDRKARPGFVTAPAVRGENVPVVTIANFVSQRLGRVVIDNTGLTSVYDFTLTWTPDPTELGPNGTPVRARSEDQASPSLVTALQEQLGLRLETRQAAVELFVIDSVEIPTPN
jgi:uncharacterized protein (TIGR03435 family)